MSAWMLYCVAVTAMLGAAAAALDGALRSRGRREARWVWAGAIAAALLAGALSLALPSTRPAAAGPDRLARGASGHGIATAAAAAGRAFAPPAAAAPAQMAPTDARLLPRPTLPSLPPLGAPLAALWATASTLVLLWLCAGALRLRRARRSWRRAAVDGVPALVSPDVGPAVVGALRSEIVLPRWVLELDPARRALVIAHEREHVRAHDPLLLAAAHAALVVAPWNPALWWLAAGLRRAVELDCDARVLRAHPDVRGYGTLLLEVGRRAALGMAGWRNVPAPAFLHASSTLERRIRIMTTSRTPHRHTTRLLLLAAALGAAVLTPRPPALLAQSAASGTGGDSAAKRRAAGAGGGSGEGRGARPPHVVRAEPARGAGAVGGRGVGSPPRVVVGLDSTGRGARASGGTARHVVGLEPRRDAQANAGRYPTLVGDSLMFRFMERRKDKQLAEGYLRCAAQQSPSGAPLVEIIVADDDANKPGRVTLLVDRVEGREIAVTFGTNTVDRVACSGTEAPWLRLSGAGVQREAHVLHVTTPVALRVVARTPSGRTLHDREIVPRTQPESITFEWGR